MKSFPMDLSSYGEVHTAAQAFPGFLSLRLPGRQVRGRSVDQGAGVNVLVKASK
jgi:hypothetical protein